MTPPPRFPPFVSLLASAVQLGTTVLLLSTLALPRSAYFSISFNLLASFALLPALFGLAYGLMFVAPRFRSLRQSAKIALTVGLLLNAGFVVFFAKFLYS